MSGAAGIAAAKNRRSRTDSVRPSVVDCKALNGSCAPKNNNQSQQQQQQQQQNRSIPAMENALVDPISMKILGPMPTPQVLKIHEQRLNRIDEQVTQLANRPIQSQQNSVHNSNNDYTEQIECMEDKIRMLEEVIMNLQLTITNVQGFAMETNLAMMKMKREQEEKAHEASLSASLSAPKHHIEVDQASLSDIDIDVSVLPSSSSSSVDLTDIIDTIHNDEIVVSNITYALNNSY
jgi:hypothetical protein